MPFAFLPTTTMDKEKRLGILLRLLSLIFGFGFICVGAYVKALEGANDTSVPAILAYILVASGFVLLLIGAFWSVLQSIRSNLYRRGGNSRRGSHQLYVCTVDRPSFYPPSYEESQSRGTTVIPMDRGCLGLAPPLYTSSSEVEVSEDFSHELPPSYYLVTRLNPQNPSDPPQRDAWSGLYNRGSDGTEYQ